MKEIPDHIFERAREGNKEAFHELYTIAAGFVYGSALRVMRNQSDAEEVTQDVFMKVYRNLKKFEIGTSFTGWLYRITFNTALNACKKRSRENTKRDEYKFNIDKECVEPSAHDTLDKEYHAKKLDKLLAILNPDQRACIVLREIEGLDYKEIAGVLKINLNTVRTRLKRAREALIKYARKEVISYEM